MNMGIEGEEMRILGRKRGMEEEKRRRERNIIGRRIMEGIVGEEEEERNRREEEKIEEGLGERKGIEEEGKGRRGRV